LTGAGSSHNRGSDPTFEAVVESLPDAMLGVDGRGTIAIANDRAAELFGYGRDALIGAQIERLVPDRFHHLHPAHLLAGQGRPGQQDPGMGLFAIRSDGTEFPAEINVSSVVGEQGPLAIAAIRDVTDRAETERERALQEELHRTRRLESIGQLAGGIAHDFNNILGVIINYAHFVQEDLEKAGLAEDSQPRQDTKEIGRAAERAAALTRQLLIFSRREVVKPEVLDLGKLIRELEMLLERALGERVELRIELPRDLAPIEADPGQIEQVLVNLAVNARDAMPDGGTLLIEVEPVELDGDFNYMHPDTPSGHYIRLKVSDTGTGMEQKVVERAFEPFFSTKPKGEGTGLGLATVYGIVTQAGGRVDIYSELGIGTTVKIHFPATRAIPAERERLKSAPPLGRGEVVLVVEDEADVRRMADRMLSRSGYAVIGAADGAEAISLCERSEQPIDLVLTDVIMPHMLGTEVVEQIRAERPDVGVIYMSGYSHSVLAPQALFDQPTEAFLEKPFNAEQLLRTVRGVLDAAGTPTGAREPG
jgi:PAS domain S-box-containing protein